MKRHKISRKSRKNRGRGEGLALKLLELGFVEGGVDAVFGHEFSVIALLGNSFVLDDEDAVGFDNGGETMGDDKAGAAFH